MLRGIPGTGTREGGMGGNFWGLIWMRLCCFDFMVRMYDLIIIF